MDAFRDRVVLITGAGSGIGRQLAVTLAGLGARIAAIDRRPDLLDELTCCLGGANLATAAADVTDLTALRQAAATLENQLGPVDRLIACAGIGRQTPADAFSAEEVNAHIQVNLSGVVNSVDAVLPGMRQRRRGHLIVLSSLASYRGMPLMSAYCASKAGVNALFDALRVELASFGIHVTTVCPGWIHTPMTAPLRLPARQALTVEDACAIIVAAIRERRPFIAFPARLAWQVRLLRYLPRGLSDWMTARQFERARRLLPSDQVRT